MYRFLFLIFFMFCLALDSNSQTPDVFPSVDKNDLQGAKIAPYRTFNGSSLYGYIDGGAELYLEYGFSGAAITTISYQGKDYKTEIYRMNGPEEAFGIFSVSKYRCLNMPPLACHSCQARYQLQFCKGPFYVNIVNYLGSSADSTNMLLIGKIIADKIKDPEVDLSGYLPGIMADSLKKNCFLAKGKLGIVNGNPDLEDFFKEITDYTAVILKDNAKTAISVKFNNTASYRRFLELHNYQEKLLSENNFISSGGENLRKLSDNHLYIESFENNSANIKVENKVSEDVLILNPGPDNPRNSEGDFITLKDGCILYVYSHYTGSSGDDNGNAYLAGRYSYDKGRTWTKEDVRIVDQEGTMNVMSVSLLRLQNGKIALFYLRKNSTTDCQPLIRISDDEALTWSAPNRCITDREGYFVLNNNRVIQLKSGRLLLAVALHQSPGEEKASDVGRLWCYHSDDNGLTWKRSAEVGNPGNIVTQEPGLVELKNGDIMMFVRTTAGVQYFSWSKDKGETWSAVEPGNLKSPCSPASIARMPSTGDLLAVWNDNGVDQKRTPLNIAISKDDGKSWTNNKILENNADGSYCYTAIHFVENDVLLGYFNWQTIGVTIKKIGIDWIYK